MMNKKFVYIFIVFLFICFGLAIALNIVNSGKKDNNTHVSKMSTDVNINNTSTSIDNNVNEIHIALHDVDEQQLAAFSTKLSGSDSPRSHNIGITTSILDGTTINNGEFFSFNDIVGNPTADKGYQEADSFNEEGEIVQTYGGGNCQVSSTLYNVVLQIPELEVIERSPHIKPVQYVEEGKDATVSYGSVDFQFKNNTGSTIKIYANSNLNEVYVRIVKMQ